MMAMPYLFHKSGLVGGLGITLFVYYLGFNSLKIILVIRDCYKKELMEEDP